jgi:hypothetical protein
LRSLALALLLAIVPQTVRSAGGPLVLTLQSRALASPLKLDGLYLETAQGRIELPSQAPVVLDLEGSAWKAGSRPRIPQDILESRSVLINQCHDVFRIVHCLHS